MSTNPNNLQSTAEQMRHNNANLARENADNADTNSLNPVNPSVPLNPPATLTQNNPPPIPPTLIPNNSSLSSTHTPTPIPPKQKNPPAAKAPTGSASQQATTRPANPLSSTPKHPLSLDKVATSAEKHHQSAKQTKDLAAILGAKTKKAYRERTIATNATLKRKAEKDEETATILEKALQEDAEGDKTRADMFYKIYAKLVTGRDVLW
ncbi:hypothetical protein PGT21_016667 [Puccinia graminis f. sp. tritici]|uniref:No apical meristem-associated C-terminal domain-containing protein n=1 Tax=Puccinia graminis f. sp. tritici TaxID=56615 RepID=A0A5B0QTB2_PUCGR|nr:hypothetical protein PGT21_016667 [Puccinia graminis f. sp. tritici]